MVKEFLSQRGVGITERDVSRDHNAAQELVSSTGQMGVPVTVINGQTIIGFDRAGLEQAIAQKQRPSFGVSIADAGKITARQGMAVTSGAYIGKVRPGSPAERAGLAPGDIITEVNNRSVANVADFERVIDELDKGNRFTIVFLRDNQRRASEGVI